MLLCCVPRRGSGQDVNSYTEEWWCSPVPVPGQRGSVAPRLGMGSQGNAERVSVIDGIVLFLAGTKHSRVLEINSFSLITARLGRR